MPIYEYYCPNCQKEFELMRPLSQRDDPGICPKCGTQGQRLLSVFGAKSGSYIRPAAQPAFRGRSGGEEKK